MASAWMGLILIPAKQQESNEEFSIERVNLQLVKFLILKLEMRS
jgi:hypothetical protein